MSETQKEKLTKLKIQIQDYGFRIGDVVRDRGEREYHRYGACIVINLTINSIYHSKNKDTKARVLKKTLEMSEWSGPIMLYPVAHSSKKNIEILYNPHNITKLTMDNVHPEGIVPRTIKKEPTIRDVELWVWENGDTEIKSLCGNSEQSQ